MIIAIQTRPPFIITIIIVISVITIIITNFLLTSRYHKTSLITQLILSGIRGMLAPHSANIFRPLNEIQAYSAPYS